jgi:hypothetical protein
MWGVRTVTGRRKGNSLLADEWDPMTIERKRRRKGEGCRLGLLGYEAGLLFGFRGPPT